MAVGRESPFANRLVLKGLLFAVILVLCVVGFACSAVREAKLPGFYGPHYDISRSVCELERVLELVVLSVACISLALGLGPLAIASISTWRHLKGSRRVGGLVLACVVLFFWVASIVLAGVAKKAAPYWYDNVGYCSFDYKYLLPGVGVAGGIALLMAGLLLFGIHAYLHVALKRTADDVTHGRLNQKNKPNTDEESGRADPDKDGRIKDHYGDDTSEPPPHQKQKRPKQTSAPPSGDAFAWQEMTSSQSGVGQQRSGSHFSSAHNSTSFANGGTGGMASAPPAPTPAPYGVMVLSIAEVVHATENFSVKNSIGQGGFSHVYRGILSDGRTVAVKRLHFHSLTGGQETAKGERDFQAEAAIIARVHHRHLVQLVGFCTNAQERILVLEYMENGSLADNLYGNRAASVISWPQRMIIAIGAAKGLAYLHEDCQPRIVHRDIKASNILVDGNLGAKISDFGFARFAREFQSTATATRTVGTFQYLPPECTMYGEKNTDKSDVYSFGVVLLELLAGRPPVDPGQPRDRVALLVWARQLKQTRTERFILDERLGKAYSAEEVLRVFDCAIACINDLPESRPSMGQVLRMLEGVGPNPPVPAPAVQHSTVFGTSTDVSMVIPMTMTEGR